MAEKWEYFTTLLYAEVGKGMNVGRQNAGKYAPESLIPTLNSFGDQGWELVHMEPAYVGRNDDILMMDTAPRWTQWYFCAFKRRKA